LSVFNIIVESILHIPDDNIKFTKYSPNKNIINIINMIDFIYKSDKYTVDKNGCIDKFGKMEDYVKIFSYDSYDLVWK